MVAAPAHRALQRHGTDRGPKHLRTGLEGAIWALVSELAAKRTALVQYRDRLRSPASDVPGLRYRWLQQNPAPRGAYRAALFRSERFIGPVKDYVSPGARPVSRPDPPIYHWLDFRKRHLCDGRYGHRLALPRQAFHRHARGAEPSGFSFSLPGHRPAQPAHFSAPYPSRPADISPMKHVKSDSGSCRAHRGRSLTMVNGGRTTRELEETET